jgi:hypothetical protein
MTDDVIIFWFWTLKSVKSVFRMKHDQRMIIRFLWNEGIDAHEITHKLQAQFDEYAYALRMVRFWITEVRIGRQDLHDEVHTEKTLLDDLDAKILAILEKSPFKSARSIAETLDIAYSIVLLYLHDSINFRLFHLYLVPHLLTHDLREKWMEYAQAMLPVLHTAERDNWYHLVTNDESWFFLNISSRRM